MTAVQKLLTKLAVPRVRIGRAGGRERACGSAPCRLNISAVDMRLKCIVCLDKEQKEKSAEDPLERQAVQ